MALKKKTRACWLSPNTSEGFRNPSYVSFRRFFLCVFFSFFLHCCCASVWVFVCSSHCLQAEGWRVASSPGQGFTPYQGPPSLASPFIRDHRLYLQLPAPAGTSPSLPQASGFLGRPLAPSGLSSEDPKGRCGAEVPQAGSCRCQ